MPNWCENVIVLKGDSALLKVLVESQFDFNSIKQEPNWSEGEDEEQYNWHLENWGCKWNRDDQSVSIDGDGSAITVFLQTPWDPPIAIYEALHSRGIDVDAWYCEPGAQLFGGYADGKDWAVDLEKECRKYGSLKDYLLNDPVGQRFEEYFGASEYISDEDEEGVFDETDEPGEPAS